MFAFQPPSHSDLSIQMVTGSSEATAMLKTCIVSVRFNLQNAGFLEKFEQLDKIERLVCANHQVLVCLGDVPNQFDKVGMTEPPLMSYGTIDLFAAV